ncbi:hypothetical protein ABS735_18525 [Streptomyces sp. MMCC 100]|uniref:hypothetical protein n=1 Tax=Streptomyces sp. MMCC 100 TaxID=3163555 RepID=UPI00359B2789
MGVLIAGRALQGVGAGGVLALTDALVAGLVPARRRGLCTAWFGVAFGTASVAGPLAEFRESVMTRPPRGFPH